MGDGAGGMQTLALLATAFGASALGGVLGKASGIFIVPLLTLLFGIDLHVAIGVSLVSVIACSCSSAAPFLRAGLPNLRLAVVLESATTLGALTGVFLIGLISTSLLYGLFALILIVSARQMFARRRELTEQGPPDPKAWATLLHLHADAPDDVHGAPRRYRVGNVPLGMLLMYGAGVISALLGIGSGVLKIPAMDTALRLPPRSPRPPRTS